MTHEFDEVRLTAYALGELDAAEAAEVEAFLETHPEARAEVEAIRKFSLALADELGKDASAPMLTDDQKRLIADHARTTVPDLHARPSSGAPPWYRRPGTLAAASVLLGLGILAVSPWSKTLYESAEVAYSRANQSAAEGEIRRSELDLGFPEQKVQLKDEATKSRYQDGFQKTLAKEAAAERSLVAHVEGDRSAGMPALNVPADVSRESMSARIGHDWRGLGENTGGRGVPGKTKKVAIVRDFDVEIAQGAVIADPIVDVIEVPEDDPSPSAESYSAFKENEFVRAVGEDARSTFALDVDTASYSNVRRLLRSGARPDKGAVRIEEMINYFDYDYARPVDGKPLAITLEVGQCPWAPAHKLALVGLRAKSVDRAERGRANLVFLIDVSGSMEPANRLPLVKRSLRMLVDQLRPDDRIAMVVYAGASGLVMPSTAVNEKATILDAIERLNAGGSTNGGAGIDLAYSVAKDNFVQGGINRVILCTDGDFNVGTTSESSLVDLIESRAKTGVFLTVLGFGMGNLKDSTLQKLADKGNGAYGYIDTDAEAKKLFVNQVDATLVTVAKDARIQVEFNPGLVGAYRLIGYEKRLMANRDFHDDTKDAGEVGSGHAVTALYEIIPAGSADLEKLPAAGAMRYQPTVTAGSASASAEIMTVSLRYKEPDGDKSSLVEVSARDDAGATKGSSPSFRWASAVAMFAMELRGSAFKGLTNWALVDELAREAKGDDRSGLRAEFLELIKIASGKGER